jgi:predicted alpha/beta superfamily hydrolase
VLVASIRLLSISLVLVVGCARAGATPDAFADDAALVVDAAFIDAAMARDATTADGTIADAAVVDSPDTNVDAPVGDTTIHVIYPAGHTIALRGGVAPLNWTTGMPMTDLGGGTYEIVIHGLHGVVEFKPLLDDATWSRGPNFHVTGGTRIEIAPHFVTTSGRYTTLFTWDSTSLGRSRAIYVYYPAAYDENTSARFPVLYMHDGQNLFDASLAFGNNEWMVDESMSGAGEYGHCVASGLASCSADADCGGALCDTWGDTLVIGMANTGARIAEYTPVMDPSTPGGGGGDAYLNAVVNELKPMIDSMLRTRTGPADTAMMGSSLGGLITAYAGVVHADTFGRVGPMSPSTWWDNDWIVNEVMTAVPTHTPRALRVYLDSGDSGASNDDVTDTAMLDAAYRGVGYVEGTDLHYYVQAGGQHNEIYWAQRFPGACAFLLAPRERPLP